MAQKDPPCRDGRSIIPVVLFTYNRPDLVDQVLTSLKRECVPKLLIFSDGPASPDNAGLVAIVRSMLHRINWTNVEIFERQTNWGLGKSILTGVAAVLRRYEAAVIFEDDLICTPGTYRYLCAALRHYASDERVMSVTGWTHPMILPPDVSDQPYFDGKGECWVWGTWSRAWVGMEATALEIMRRCIDAGLPVERYGTDMPKMAAEETIRNLWAVRWWYLHMLRGSLCLRPPWTLVEHLGWDGRGTTVNIEMTRWKNPPLGACPPIPNCWPEPVEHPSCPPLWRKAID
jgi:hypothetical protein